MDLMLFTSSKKKDDCAPLEAIVRAVGTKFKADLHVNVLDIDEHAHRMTALQFKISSPPALVLDGEPIFSGKRPTEEQLVKLIEGKIAEYKKSHRAGRRYWSVSGLPENWGAER